MKSMLGVPPVLEVIAPSFDQSFSFKRFDDPTPDIKPFWHHHPEIELVFVKSGSGRRHVGNHISQFSDGDLMLLGPNIPHYGLAEQLVGHRSEIVIHMKPDFLGNRFFNIPEMKTIRLLLNTSISGLVFYGSTKTIVGNKLENLTELTGFEKLLGLLDILHILGASTEFKSLDTTGPTIVFKKADNDKINRIYEYVKDHFTDNISLKTISDEISMEIPSFCRYFKRVTGKTFTEFVNEFRINQAIKLLSETDSSIAAICYESGFNNSSHFNRLFKNTTGKTPMEYRDELKHIIY